MNLQSAVHSSIGVSECQRACESAPRLPVSEIAERSRNQHESLEMGTLRERLCGRVLEAHGEMLAGSFNVVEVAESDDEVVSQVNDIVDLAYCARYSSRPPPPSGRDVKSSRPPPCNDSAPPPLNLSADSAAENASGARFALCATVGNTEIVMVTCRFVSGPEMELLKFFTLNGTRWPHEVDGCNLAHAIEVGRVAFHPLLDDCGSEPPSQRKLVGLYRTLAFRAFWSHALATLHERGYRYLYATMAPHVARYFVKVGVPMQRMVSATLRDTEQMRYLMSMFPRYWRPNGPASLQPAVYELEWELREHLELLGDLSVALSAVPVPSSIPPAYPQSERWEP